MQSAEEVQRLVEQMVALGSDSEDDAMGATPSAANWELGRRRAVAAASETRSVPPEGYPQPPDMSAPLRRLQLQVAPGCSRGLLLGLGRLIDRARAVDVARFAGVGAAINIIGAACFER